MGAPVGTPDGQRTMAWVHQHVRPHREQQMNLRAAEVSREKGEAGRKEAAVWWRQVRGAGLANSGVSHGPSKPLAPPPATWESLPHRVLAYRPGN